MYSFWNLNACASFTVFLRFWCFFKSPTRFLAHQYSLVQQRTSCKSFEFCPVDKSAVCISSAFSHSLSKYRSVNLIFDFNGDPGFWGCNQAFVSYTTHIWVYFLFHRKQLWSSECCRPAASVFRGPVRHKAVTSRPEWRTIFRGFQFHFGVTRHATLVTDSHIASWLNYCQ